MSEKYGYRKSSTVSPLMMRFVRFGCIGLYRIELNSKVFRRKKRPKREKRSQCLKAMKVLRYHFSESINNLKSCCLSYLTRSTSPGPLRKAFGSVASILAALHIPNTTTTTSAVAHDDREKVEAFVIVLVFFSLLVSIFYPTVIVWQKMVMVWRKMMVGDNRQQGARQK